MLPIRDDVPSRCFPFMTLALIVVNTAVFVFEISLGPRALARFVGANGLIPGQVAAYLASEGGVPSRAVLPFFSAIFLHGGWLHLIGNMWYLWIFGDNVEDRIGHIRFLVYFVLCGVVGNLAHFLVHPESNLPAIGASGAIAGVLGAYLVSYPRARILVLVPLFFFLQFIELPALIVLGFWFVLQFLNGAASFVASAETGGVAWWAHIGGFVGGIIIFKVFRPRSRVYYVR